VSSFDAAIWDRLLATVQSDRPDLYRAWFALLPPGRLEQGQLVVVADDEAQAHYLSETCAGVFVDAAMKVSGYLVSVRFAPRDEVVRFARPHGLSRAPLNADYTFDEFVVGPSNRLAHAACGAVSRQLGTLYNPLFIHGASGLGKTHLLQATCADLIRGGDARSAVYVTCETFVNDFVEAIAAGGLPAFRESARQIDLLVIDDIQFLANRESSQEELFHTFNALYQSRRQIILSADSPPSEIPTLEDRLVSRFKWGLVAQIDAPDRETRHAILRRKAQLRGCEVPDDVLDYVAENIEGNIRLLEGALTKLITESQLAGRPLNLQSAREILGAFQARSTRPLQISDILDTVAKHYGIRVQDLLGRKRTRSVSHPRQLAMYLARKLTQLSLEEIGMHVGGRDHSTVLHAEQAIDRTRENHPQTAEVIHQLTRKLSNRL
jgi:chromosomal replication initiator protein